MRKFLRIVDRALLHLYALAALFIALGILSEQDRTRHAIAEGLILNAQALFIIAQELHGIST